MRSKQLALTAAAAVFAFSTTSFASTTQPTKPLLLAGMTYHYHVHCSVKDGKRYCNRQYRYHATPGVASGKHCTMKRHCTRHGSYHSCHYIKHCS